MKAFAKPVDGGDVLVLGDELVGEGARLRAEGVFGGDEQVCVLVVGVGDDEQTAAGGEEVQGAGVTRAQGVG